MKVLLVAKAPVAGRVKTRLGALVGDDVAADLAAAALLDTLEACRESGATGHLSLSGDLSEAVRGAEIRAALDGWTITPQVGDGFAERLVRAHADAGPGLVVQIGMDTPQVTAAALHEVADAMAGHDAVLAPATDGGLVGARPPRRGGRTPPGAGADVDRRPPSSTPSGPSSGPAPGWRTRPR